MSSIIPRDKAQAYQRWELASFDRPFSSAHPVQTRAPAPPEVAQEPEPENIEMDVHLPTAEEIEQVHSEARAEGYEQGLKEGTELALAEEREAIAGNIKQLASITDNFAAALDDLDQELAEDIMAFSIELARQMVGASLQVRPESLLPVIREAMAALPLHHGTVLVHINPSDAEQIKTHFGEQLAHAGWRIVENREIQAGGCRLIAGNSEVDASVETRWRRILASFGAKPEWLEPGP